MVAERGSSERDADGPASRATEGPLVELEGIRKDFRGVRALQSVDLRLDAGAVHALIGQNGAGKSTLIRILTGALAPDAGQIRIGGRPIRFSSPAEARAAGIAVVHQDGQLFPDLSIADNVFVGQPDVRRLGPLPVRDKRRSRREAHELLSRLGVELDPQAPVSQLAPTERKLIEVARALAADARVLVLDEPTATLGPAGTRRLFDVMRRLKEQGVSILFVSHKLDEVIDISERVTVLKDGSVLESTETAKLDLKALVRLLAGDELTEQSGEAPQLGEVVARAKEVAAPSLSPTSVELKQGQLVAFTGLVGSGAATLGRLLAAAAPQDRGTVVVGEEELRPGDRATAVRLGVGLVPEDRRHAGVFPDLSIERNVALSSLPAVTRRATISRAAMREQAERYIRLLGIRPASPQMPVGNLSGGNQQKVVLARWLASGARILVTEEPTHGLDVAAKAEIYGVLREFASDGGCVVVVSLDISEYEGLPNEIGVFRSGELVEMLSGDASAAEVESLAMGVGETPAS